MIERRIKGRVVGIDNTAFDPVYFILKPEEASWNRRKKNRRIVVPVRREDRNVLALLDAAFLKDYIVSVAGLHEDGSDFVYITSTKGIKVEVDQ